jgi:antitoxin (DNA-binding transcriptional repressor) of toxin-antitoxin stability system
MRFISVRELNTKPKEIWGKIKNEEVIITSNGRPIALMSAVNEETLEKTIRTLRRSRALMALEDLQNKALISGMDKLNEAEIEFEIQAVRKSRRK